MKKFLRILLVVVAALVLIGVGMFAGFRISSYQYAAMAAQTGAAQPAFPFQRPHFRQVAPQGSNPAVPQQGQPNLQVPQQGQPQGGTQSVPPQAFRKGGKGPQMNQQFWGQDNNRGFRPGSRNGFQMMPGARGGFQESRGFRPMLPMLALLVLCPVGLVILGLAVWGVIALLRRRSKTHPCPHCSKPVQDGWVACPSCGKSLDEKTDPAPEPESK